MQEPPVSFTTAFPPDIGADITALLKTVMGGDLITLLGVQPCAPHEVPPMFDPTWAYSLELRPTLESGAEVSSMRVRLGQLRHTDRWGIWSLISRDKDPKDGSVFVFTKTVRRSSHRVIITWLSCFCAGMARGSESWRS